MSQVTLKTQFDLARKLIQRAEEAALEDAGEHLLEESNRTIPIEEHILEGTGDVSRDGLTVQVGYVSPYAVRQHEELGYQHDAGRRAKWLQLTFQERMAAVKGWLAAGIRRRMP